jgi:hypothetical protein
MIKQLEKSVRVKESAETAHVSSLIREYKQKRWVANSDRLGKPDSLSAWCSIQDLENFITEAKSNGGDGVRFYFAAYPDNYQAIPGFAGRQTILHVATKSKVSLSGDVKNKDMYVLKNGQTHILFGGNDPLKICPPICGNSEGGMGDLGITIVDKGNKGMEVI